MMGLRTQNGLGPFKNIFFSEGGGWGVVSKMVSLCKKDFVTSNLSLIVGPVFDSIRNVKYAKFTQSYSFCRTLGFSRDIIPIMALYFV